ncbi:MAG: exonuclease SbcCD subunit D C-terminal domain-containing protein [Myxococcales bacterium]|nr:exonuclease SbcCD subunit D C-terminal domain-containing protein [Myxococcales bacterium]
MRLLHTSDWHLGHALHDLPRDREHAAFLAWLLDTIEAEQIDAVLLSGDVFDAGNPSAPALAAWYGFLAEAHRRRPHLTVVAIAGNHDSPARLTAPAALLAGVRARVIGAVPRTADGAVVTAPLVVALPDATGAVGAIVAAVPYLRPGDLAAGDGDRGDAVRAVFAEVLAAARAQRQPGQALVAMGHLHLAGGQASDSERRIVIGGAEVIGGAAFADDVAYVALGHLHRAQRVGAEHVRYAGSPIPLAMGEADYHHQVVVVELAGGELSGIRTIRVPRTVELVRVPRRGAAALPEVLAQLAKLPAYDPDGDPDLRPYLEVRVRLDAPAPRLRLELEAAVRERHPRLVKITVEAGGDRRALAEAGATEVLAQLDPREVLTRLWRREHGGDVPAPIAAAFEVLQREISEAPS